MTTAEFLAALEKTPRTWFLHNGALRSHGACPVIAVYRAVKRESRHNIGEYVEAGKAIGLSARAATSIAWVADYGQIALPNGRRPPKGLRAELLRACGLDW